MAEYLTLFIGAVVVNNFVLTKFLGLCIFFGISKNFSASVGMGCGFTLAMLIISVIRELLGAGTILGVPVFGASYQPMLMMVLPPGAFILIGYLVAATKTWNKRRERAREKAARIAVAKGAER